MPIRAEVDATDREGCYDFLDDQFVVNIVENNLAVESDGAHQQLVEWTEAEALDVAGVLVELGNQLAGGNVVEAASAMVGD